MAYYGNILEEELKNKVAQDLFSGFDTTQIIGRVDFCVSIPADPLGLNEAGNSPLSVPIRISPSLKPKAFASALNFIPSVISFTGIYVSPQWKRIIE